MTEKKQKKDETMKFKDEIFLEKLESLSMIEFKEFFGDDITAKNQRFDAAKKLEAIRESFFSKTMTPLKNEVIYSEILNRKQELMKKIVANSIKDKKFLDLIPLEIMSICESVADNYALVETGLKFNNIDYCSVGINNLLNWSAKPRADELIPKIKEKWNMDEMDDRLAGIIRSYDKCQKNEKASELSIVDDDDDDL